MASEDLVKELCEAMVCPICLDYFRDPVMLDCGHNFCQACILQYWMESNRTSACLECRKPFQQRDSRSNWQLANIVPLIKALEEGRRAERKRDVCRKHHRPLKFFCRDDQAPLCAACKRAKAHRAHSVLVVDEAARELKEKIKAQLMSLEEEREKRVTQKMPTEVPKRARCEKMARLLERPDDDWDVPKL